MPRFIPIDKMRRLREAAKGGDERAKRIISAHLDGKEDFTPMLDEFFAPQKPESQPVVEASTAEAGSQPQGGDYDENPKLAQFLELNKIGHDSPDYASFVDDFYKENPDEKPLHHGHGHEGGHEGGCPFQPLIDDEIEAISGYQQAILRIISDADMPEAAKKGILSDLEEIKRDEVEHLDKLRRLKASVEDKKKDEAVPMQPKEAEIPVEQPKTII